MLIRELTAEHIYLACGHTDMRKSIDGLAALVVSRFHLDPHQPALFLFCGRRKDRIKGLLWDETGFLLLYKRLEDGKYQWPDESPGAHDRFSAYPGLVRGASRRDFYDCICSPES